MPVAFAALCGLIVGSFLNVVAYRLPRGESLVTPGSHCPSCSTEIRPYDNLPVLGWLALRGAATRAGMSISARYPLVEGLTAVLAVAVVLVEHSAHDIALGLALIAILVPIALIDLDHRIIPNEITLPAALAAVGIGLLTRPGGVPEQLIAGAAAGGFLLVFVLAYPRGMGMGDVKLAAVLGLFLGRSVAVALLAGVLLGAIVGAGIMVRVGVTQGRKTAVPFGPFLALGDRRAARRAGDRAPVPARRGLRARPCPRSRPSCPDARSPVRPDRPRPPSPTRAGRGGGGVPARVGGTRGSSPQPRTGAAARAGGRPRAGRPRQRPDAREAPLRPHGGDAGRQPR